MWEQRRILVLGSTYPNYSNKYKEVACTGGIDERTGEMVRLFPMPRRYLDEERKFSKWQWIEVDVRKHGSDPRPESYRVNLDSIRPDAVISSGRPQQRRAWLEQCPHLCRSLEDLRDRYDKDGTSLGIVRPRRIGNIKLEQKDQSDAAEWARKEQALLSQLELPGFDSLKPIDYIPVRFLVQWECEDDRCRGHEMGIMEWGLHELFRKLARDEANPLVVEQKVLQKMRQELSLDEKDVFFFLGNYRATLYQFGLLDTYSPPADPQLKLF